MVNRLRELRDSSKLTQQEVAKLIDVSPSLVAAHELGTRTITLADLGAYARIFKVTTAEIFMRPVGPDKELVPASAP